MPLSEMGDLDAAPMLVQVLRDETPVAVVGLVFAAQEATVRDDLPGDRLLDPPLPHQGEEAILVGLPVALPLFEVVEDYLRRGKRGKVDVLHAAKLIEKVGEVVLLGETGELRPIVEPYVDDASGARLTE